MKKPQRLVGVDVLRGLAIFAVIILHIDEGLQTTPVAWSKITDFAFFSVPFFLATAFYLAISKLYVSKSPYPLFSRLKRLLIPYAAWSMFYLIYKVAKYTVDRDPNRVLALFQDPLSLVFFGGASYHLYFLPLLLTGTLLVKLTEFLIARQASWQGIGLVTLVSVLIYEVVLISGNGLKTPGDVAFEPLLAAVLPGGNSNPQLRLFLVALVWALRCLPYILVAMLLAHPSLHERWLAFINKQPVLWLVIFIVFNLFGGLVLPQAVNEVARGYVALIAAIAISGRLTENALVRNIGLCSFGIYLIHIFFVEVFQSVAIRIIPSYNSNASTTMLLIASMLIFCISWGTTSLLLTNKRFAQIL